MLIILNTYPGGTAMWREIGQYVVLALAGLVCLSLLVMLLAILRTYLFKHTPDRLRNSRGAVRRWALTSLVLAAALVAGGLVLAPRTTTLDLAAAPAGPVTRAAVPQPTPTPAPKPTPAPVAAPAPAPSPAFGWSHLVGQVLRPLTAGLGRVPEPSPLAKPAIPRGPAAKPIPSPAPKPVPSIKTGPSAPSAGPRPRAPATGPAVTVGWPALLARLKTPGSEPALPPRPRVALPSTSVEPEPRPGPTPPAKPAPPTPAPPAAKTKPSGPPASGVTAPQTSAGPPPPRTKPAPPPAVKPQSKTEPPPASSQRCWALVTDSFRRKHNAQYTARLRRKLGLRMHPVIQVKVRGRSWYRVVLGCFATRQAARRYGNRLHKNGETRDRPQVISVPNVKPRGGR